jgi:hypothetical protein
MSMTRTTRTTTMMKMMMTMMNTMVQTMMVMMMAMMMVMMMMMMMMRKLRKTKMTLKQTCDRKRLIYQPFFPLQDYCLQRTLMRKKRYWICPQLPFIVFRTTYLEAKVE